MDFNFEIMDIYTSIVKTEYLLSHKSIYIYIFICLLLFKIPIFHNHFVYKINKKLFSLDFKILNNYV